jgi:hypothetical protein
MQIFADNFEDYISKIHEERRDALRKLCSTISKNIFNLAKKTIENENNNAESTRNV